MNGEYLPQEINAAINLLERKVPEANSFSELLQVVTNPELQAAGERIQIAAITEILAGFLAKSGEKYRILSARPLSEGQYMHVLGEMKVTRQCGIREKLAKLIVESVRSKA